MAQKAKKKKGPKRNLAAWAMTVLKRKGGPMRDRRERRAKDARRIREQMDE
jgi:hypothetical protein